MTIAKTHSSFFVHTSIAAKLKKTASGLGWTRYSVTANRIIQEAYNKIQTIDDYSILEEKYKRQLAGFVSLKRGRPANTKKMPKVRLSVSLSQTSLGIVRRVARKYALSLTASAELLFRIGL